MAVVAVLEIHMDRNIVVNMNPSINLHCQMTPWDSFLNVLNARN